MEIKLLQHHNCQPHICRPWIPCSVLLSTKNVALLNSQAVHHLTYEKLRFNFDMEAAMKDERMFRGYAKVKVSADNPLVEYEEVGACY